MHLFLARIAKLKMIPLKLAFAISAVKEETNTESEEIKNDVQMLRVRQAVR